MIKVTIINDFIFFTIRPSKFWRDSVHVRSIFKSHEKFVVTNTALGIKAYLKKVKKIYDKSNKNI